MVELCQRLHVDRQAGVPVVSHGVQGQPGQRVVSLQHEPEHQNETHSPHSPSSALPEDVSGVVAVQTVHPPTGRLRHEAVVSSHGEVGAVDVEGGLEEDWSGGLQVRGGGPEPDNVKQLVQSVSLSVSLSPSRHGSSPGGGGEVAECQRLLEDLKTLSRLLLAVPRHGKSVLGPSHVQ